MIILYQINTKLVNIEPRELFLGLEFTFRLEFEKQKVRKKVQRSPSKVKDHVKSKTTIMIDQ